MNTEQLVKRLAQKTGMSVAGSNGMLNAMLDVMASTLKNGEDIHLRNFGSFMIKQRKPRRTRDIHSGRMVTISARKVVKFSTRIV